MERDAFPDPYHPFVFHLDVVAVESPPAETLIPFGCFISCDLFDGLSLPDCCGCVNPGFKLVGSKVWEGEQKVRHVTFWVDDESRDVVAERFSEKDHAKPSLSRAGHTDDDSVGCEA